MTLVVTIAMTVYFVAQMVAHLLLRTVTDFAATHNDRVWTTVYVTGCDVVRLLCLMTLLHTLAF